MTKLIDLFFAIVFLLLAVGCTIMAFVQKNGFWMFYALVSYLLSYAMYKEFIKLYKEA